MPKKIAMTAVRVLADSLRCICRTPDEFAALSLFPHALGVKGNLSRLAQVGRCLAFDVNGDN
jgi:hypothetical protein